MAVWHSDSIVRLEVNEDQLKKIAKIDNVATIDKVQGLKLCDNLARSILKSDFKLNDTVFQGEGQTITVADTGFDSGSAPKAHSAFKDRVVGLVPVGRVTETDDVQGHGSHVCGSALGDENSETIGGVIQGTALKADLSPYGTGGNEGEEKTAAAGVGQVGGQSSAKNCITVRSCDNQRPSKDNTFTAYEEKSDIQGDPNHFSGFSSRVPTAEGRIEPDVIAPGAMILSTRSSKAPQQTDFGECKDQAWMFDTGTRRRNYTSISY
ncbi:kp-43 peptidase [Fusarium avenaceum]|nr:kp-43 peptidase [Fusarium avenaceum]